MYRSAMCAVILTILATGCQKDQQKKDDMQARQDYGVLEPDMYATDTKGSTLSATGNQPNQYSSYSSPTDVGDASYYEPPASGGTTHTVAKGDTLFSLARKYYQNPSKWRDIYEANRSAISDPNKIRIGQKLVIP